MGKVRITATFNLDDDCNDWTPEGDAIEGFRKLIEAELSDFYFISNLKVRAEDAYCIARNGE